MTFENTFGTPAAAGASIRHDRMKHGLTQQALADSGGVSWKFLIDLESSHDRADLGKTTAVLAALGLSLATTTSIPLGSDHDPERRDYAATVMELLTTNDFEFAIKMLADYASASLKEGRPLLQRSPQLKDSQWTAALAVVTNYTAHRLNQPGHRLNQTHPTPQRGMDAGQVLPERPRTRETTHSVRNTARARRHERLHPRMQPGHSMSASKLTNNPAVPRLDELANRVAGRGIHCDVDLVGGAALILHGIGNRPTAYIDASYPDKDTINTIATGVSTDHDPAADRPNSEAADVAQNKFAHPPCSRTI